MSTLARGRWRSSQGPPSAPPKSKLLPFIQDYSKRGEAKIGFPENVLEEIRGSLMGAWEEV